MIRVLKIFFVGLLLLRGQETTSLAQSFMNLNFELVSGPLPERGHGILPDGALIRWSSGSGVIGYNDMSLGGPIVSLVDTNANPWELPIEGRFSVSLTGGFMGSTSPASIAQTGLIPSWARSLMFYSTSPGMFVTFGGQPLASGSAYSGPAYSAYVADVSLFAGQTGELRFSMPGGHSGVLDSISFWASPVPEPGTLSFALLGALVLGWHRAGRMSGS